MKICIYICVAQLHLANKMNSRLGVYSFFPVHNHFFVGVVKFVEMLSHRLHSYSLLIFS